MLFIILLWTCKLPLIFCSTINSNFSFIYVKVFILLIYKILWSKLYLRFNLYYVFWSRKVSIHWRCRRSFYHFWYCTLCLHWIHYLLFNMLGKISSIGIRRILINILLVYCWELVLRISYTISFILTTFLISLRGSFNLC